jgi:hypothetical protein
MASIKKQPDTQKPAAKIHDAWDRSADLLHISQVIDTTQPSAFAKKVAQSHTPESKIK